MPFCHKVDLALSEVVRSRAARTTWVSWSNGGQGCARHSMPAAEALEHGFGAVTMVTWIGMARHCTCTLSNDVSSAAVGVAGLQRWKPRLLSETERNGV